MNFTFKAPGTVKGLRAWIKARKPTWGLSGLNKGQLYAIVYKLVEEHYEQR